LAGGCHVFLHQPPHGVAVHVGEEAIRVQPRFTGKRGVVAAGPITPVCKQQMVHSQEARLPALQTRRLGRKSRPGHRQIRHRRSAVRRLLCLRPC